MPAGCAADFLFFQALLLLLYNSDRVALLDTCGIGFIRINMHFQCELRIHTDDYMIENRSTL